MGVSIRKEVVELNDLVSFLLHKLDEGGKDGDPLWVDILSTVIAIVATTAFVYFVIL